MIPLRNFVNKIYLLRAKELFQITLQRYNHACKDTSLYDLIV